MAYFDPKDNETAIHLELVSPNQLICRACTAIRQNPVLNIINAPALDMTEAQLAPFLLAANIPSSSNRCVLCGSYFK